ncbi:MAG TPA: hypothetical protein VFQ44_16575 [Streptosporangiaceae bacterium]|nr:hypothetical protein [Streptosporangiaceae bacterium]
MSGRRIATAEISVARWLGGPEALKLFGPAVRHPGPPVSGQRFDVAAPPGHAKHGHGPLAGSGIAGGVLVRGGPGLRIFWRPPPTLRWRRAPYPALTGLRAEIVPAGKLPKVSGRW